MPRIPRRPLPIALLSAASDPSVAMLAAVAVADGEAPDWIQLLRSGVNQTVDGRGPFLADATSIAANSLGSGDRLAVDENHSTDLAAPQGLPSPAVGWIVELSARTDGLWARVEWNATGKALLADKAYRGVSPVITYRADGAVVRVLRASLTNRPNLIGLKSLNHAESDDMSLLERLRVALSLPETADEAACLAAVSVRGSDEVATLGAIRTELKLEVDATREALLSTVKARGLEIATLQAEIVSQNQALQALQAEGKKTAATACVDGAIKAGKIGVKPLRDHYIARHMTDAAAVERELAAMPAIAGRLGDDKTTVARLSSEATADEIAAAADRYLKEQAENGISLNFAQAVRAVTAS